MLLYDQRDRKELRTASSTFTQLLSSECLEFKFNICFTSTETIRTVRGGEPRMDTSSFTQLLNSVWIRVRCCFTSTETVGTMKSPGRPPRLSPAPELSAVTVLSSSSVLLFVHRDPQTIRDWEEPRTATSTFTQLLSSVWIRVQCCLTPTETVRTNSLWGRGRDQDGHLDFYTAPEL